MRKLLFAILLSAAGVAAATDKIAYVVDKPDVQIRSGPSTRNKILRIIAPGAMLVVLEEDLNHGYSRVATEDNLEGWILSRQLSVDPPAHTQAEAASTQKLESLMQENRELKAEVVGLKRQFEETSKAKEDAGGEVQRLNGEMAMIRQASSNTLALLDERNQLQEKAAALENEVENLRREKDLLAEKDSQDWFLKGAAVLFSGVMVGLIAPKLGGRRRPRWDSF